MVVAAVLVVVAPMRLDDGCGRFVEMQPSDGCGLWSGGSSDSSVAVN